MKSTSTWKRHQFCGGIEVFGTQCYIDEITDIVWCSCTKQDNLKGFDWTIIFYLFKMVYKEKTHLLDRYSKTRIIVHKNKSGKIWLIDSMQP